MGAVDGAYRRLAERSEAEIDDSRRYKPPGSRRAWIGESSVY